MNDQLTMFTQPPEECTSAQVFYCKHIEPTLTAEINKLWAAPELLSFRPNQSQEKTAPDSVWYGSAILMRVALKKKQKYIAVPAAYAYLLAPSLKTKMVKSDEGFVRVFLDDPAALSSIISVASAALKNTIKAYPIDFDCCSRYKECSDAFQCVQPNKGLSMGCSYKRKLHDGIVFFGKNRNIQ